MAKNNSTGIVEVNESEVRSYLDQQVKEAVKRVLEEIMNAEAEELLCAKPYERSEERQDYRNGSRMLISTQKRTAIGTSKPAT